MDKPAGAWSKCGMTQTHDTDAATAKKLDPTAEAILSFLQSVPPNKPVSPEQVAKEIAAGKTKPGEKPSPTLWRRYFQSVKDQARHLARTGRIEITRRGRVCDPDDLKGVWRMRLPRND